MNREKDSAIVFELVTSRYKIAERNRLAKFRFLNTMKSGSIKRRDSEPSMANTEKAQVERADISVPGTPVSSRYVESLRKINRKHHFESDSESEDTNIIATATGNPSIFQTALDAGLKKFTSDMEKLHHDVSRDPLQKYFEESDKKKTFRRDFSEVVSEFPIRKKEPDSKAKVDRYFQESDRLNSFQRDFTEVVRTFDPRNPSGRDEFTDLKKIGTPISSRLIAVEKISSDFVNGSVNDIKHSNGIIENDKHSQVRLHSKRTHNESDDFIKHESGDIVTKQNGNLLEIIEDNEVEVVSDEIDITDGENLKVPDGLEAASSLPAGIQQAVTLPAVMLLLPDDMLITKVSLPFENSENLLPGSPIHEVLPALEVLSEEIRESDLPPPKPARAPPSQSTPKQEKPFNEIPKRSKRSDSTASDISVPGTPVSSREVLSLKNRTYIDTDDSGSENEEEGTITQEGKEIRQLARDFVNEIENLVQKSFDDDDRQEIVLDELKKITLENDEAVLEGGVEVDGLKNESDEKLIIQEEQHDSFNPDGSGNKVKAYFEMSKKDNKYARSFSEVANFNEVSMDVKEKVENYFRESEQKKSYKRPFSQAINYVEPKIDIDNLLKPGTPISSEVILCLKNQNQSKSREEDFEIDPEDLKGQEAFKKAHEALHGGNKENFVVDDYFKQSQERNTYRRNFSEVLDKLGNNISSERNPEIERYFEQSDSQKSFARPFSQVLQSMPPRIDDILKVEEKIESKTYQRSSRASSVSSTGSFDSENGLPKKPKKNGKKYGIDKYFAASLYRTAYHRNNPGRLTNDGELDVDQESLKIVEDEDVFGETDLLRRHEFQHDDETRVTQDSNDVNANQTVHFWRDFLKPYNLNLQTEITITKDDLLNNRTLE